MNLLRLIFLFFSILIVIFEVIQTQRNGKWNKIAWYGLILLSGGHIIFTVILWFNHINFPLDLDIMEGVIWQHFQRAASFQFLYVQPSPAYVPLAYNPLFYYLAVPFSWIFGVNLFTLRFVAIIGMAGSGAILFLVIHRETGALDWAMLSVGLYAAAYLVMDAYLDTAHSDSWLVFSALLGSYLIYLNRSRWVNLIGIVILVAAFWFKQHGALFTIGGLLFLTFREGPRKSINYWLVAAALGPFVYIFAGPGIFGPYFHYFTWIVPSQWSELTFGTLRRFLWFILRSYPLLALSSAWLLLWAGLRAKKRLNIWHIQLFFAVLSGFMGSLDPGSSNNVYIPMGMFFILIGTLGLHEMNVQIQTIRNYRFYLLAFYVTFTLFLYNPLTVVISSQAKTSYQDLVRFLRSLDGTVYAPTLGQLPDDFTLFPAAHWVALEDLIRGPGRDTSNHPNTRLLLEPALRPKGNAYILANLPLEVYPWMAFLRNYYVLEEDFGNRFEPLRGLPRRFENGWPRYLYRYAPEKTDPN